LTTTAATGSGAAIYPITASGAAIANYNIVYVPGALTITKAPLTITADNKSRNYGVANPAFTITYSGFVNGDTQAALTTPATATTVATSTTAPGSYAITANGAASGNYSFNYVNGTLTIVPLTITNLTSLGISSGTLSPTFATATATYKASVDNAVDNIKLLLVFDPTATARINGSSAPNGSYSSGVPLKVGDNTITVTITAQDGITQNTYTLTIYRGESIFAITATNILTPNGDGKNDYWIVKDIQLYPNNTVTVFDKGGRTIYSKHGYNNEWDGTLKGAALNEGTYYYVIDLGPGLRQFRGYISILRSN
jgi:gliding motility-associated-like protein